MKKPFLIISFLFGSAALAKPPFTITREFQPIEIKASDACFSPIEKCDVKLMSFIGLAEKQLDIVIFSITHTEIAEAIKNAKNRGVQVRMVVDRQQAQAENSKVKALKEAGIEIKFGAAKSMTHDKFTIVDLRQIQTGSYNYTVNATLNNLENQIYISDTEIIQKFSAEFERIWQEGTIE